LRYGTVAKQRTLAVNLAEEQLEVMRSFGTVPSTGTADCATVAGSYDDIGTCADGVTTYVGELAFDTTWAVDSYTQNADGTHTVWDTDSSIRADFKTVTITVSWVDGLGESQSIQLSDMVDATAPFNTGKLVTQETEDETPIVKFNIDDFPGVVEIALGDDKIKGSTTPQPEIKNSGNNVETTFDVVTFVRQGEGDTFLQRREEFKIVSCVCNLDAGLSMGNQPIYWDGEEYAESEQVSKRSGTVVSTGQLAGQPFECDECCSEHHDGTNSMATESNTEYVEACRFVRKGGFFTLTTDMSLENIVVLDADLPTDSNADYSSSVTGFVTDFIDGSSVSTYPGTQPTPTYDLTVPDIQLSTGNDSEQAAARAIYLDYMHPDLLKKVKCLKASESGGFPVWSSFCDPATDPRWLEIVPFYDLDVTSLANWSRAANAIDVSNSPISDIDRTSFSRGFVQLAQNFYDVTTTVTADIEFSNTGLTDTNPIDPDDENHNSDALGVTVTIGSGGDPEGIFVTGEIKAGRGNINVETVRAYTNTGSDCTITVTGVGGNQVRSYSCELEPNTLAYLAFTDYNALKTAGNTTTVLDRQVCPSAAVYSSSEVFFSGSVANPDLNQVGELSKYHFNYPTASMVMDITVIDQTDTCPAIAVIAL
jgi:hypothetical protein